MEKCVSSSAFDAAQWITEAFNAGIFPRVNANGDLALDVVNADPQDTQRLLDRLIGHSEDRSCKCRSPTATSST